MPFRPMPDSPRTYAAPPRPQSWTRRICTILINASVGMSFHTRPRPTCSANAAFCLARGSSSSSSSRACISEHEQASTRNPNSKHTSRFYYQSRSHVMYRAAMWRGPSPPRSGRPGPGRPPPRRRHLRPPPGQLRAGQARAGRQSGGCQRAAGASRQCQGQVATRHSHAPGRVARHAAGREGAWRPNRSLNRMRPWIPPPHGSHAAPPHPTTFARLPG